MTNERLSKLNNLRSKIIDLKGTIKNVEHSGLLSVTRFGSDGYSAVVNKEDKEFSIVVDALKSKLSRLEKEFEEG